MSLIRRSMAVLAVFALLGGCERSRLPGDESGTALEPTVTEPAQAVARLVDDLRGNDLAGYARHAVPPALHARLQTAWAEERTHWPLTELPLDDRLPGFITTLAAPGAEKALLAAYNRQFAGAHGELRSAVATLGLFATQYVRSEGDYSDDERDHHVQLIAAMSQWGQRAPLGDPQHARVAIAQLVSAARLTGLAGSTSAKNTAASSTFAQAGMDRSLRRLGPFFGRFKQVLVGYGLDFDVALASAQITLAEQTGDQARVRVRYTLAGQPIDARVRVERHDGQWYLTDVLRHAQAEAARPSL